MDCGWKPQSRWRSQARGLCHLKKYLCLVQQNGSTHISKTRTCASYASVRHVTQRDLSAICSSSATAMKSRGEVDALCERVYFFHVNEFTVLERIVSRTAFIQKLHQVLESNFCSSSSSVGSEMSSRQSPSLILPCQGDKPCSKSN